MDNQRSVIIHIDYTARKKTELKHMLNAICYLYYKIKKFKLNLTSSTTDHLKAFF